MDRTTYSYIPEYKLREILKTIVEPDMYEALEDVPFEWLEVLYLDRIRFGEKYEEVKQFLDRLLADWSNSLSVFAEKDYQRINKSDEVASGMIKSRTFIHSNGVTSYLMDHGIRGGIILSYIKTVCAAIQGKENLTADEYHHMTVGLRTFWPKFDSEAENVQT